MLKIAPCRQEEGDVNYSSTLSRIKWRHGGSEAGVADSDSAPSRKNQGSWRFAVRNSINAVTALNVSCEINQLHKSPGVAKLFARSSGHIMLQLLRALMKPAPTTHVVNNDRGRMCYAQIRKLAIASRAETIHNHLSSSEHAPCQLSRKCQ